MAWGYKSEVILKQILYIHLLSVIWINVQVDIIGMIII